MRMFLYGAHRWFIDGILKFLGYLDNTQKGEKSNFVGIRRDVIRGRRHEVQAENPFPFGCLIGTEESSVVYIYRRIPLEKISPRFDLLKEINLNPETVKLLTTCRNTENLCSDNVLFLDIETTGLTVGPSDVAVIIGLGFFRDGYFHIEQLFLRNYEDEYASLVALSERLKNFSYLVGYNLKSFDYNFLKKRFLYKRMRIPSHLDFIDLYISVRRFFGKRFDSWRLKYVEEVLLKRKREDDLPSELIPEYWLKFVRTRDVRYAYPILSHNVRDIMGMLYLFLWFFLRMKRPYGCRFSNFQDKISVLNLLLKYKMNEAIEESFGYILKKESDGNCKKFLLENYANVVREE
ncbi:MAG: ribonuclease H-like domain-containing protein [Candidatus Hydrogenedentes bacterium]|nr:ribonuclease H-like domain-containing protein [Candidatus Hydrogenedentota bacterium]